MSADMVKGSKTKSVSLLRNNMQTSVPVKMHAITITDNVVNSYSFSDKRTADVAGQRIILLHEPSVANHNGLSSQRVRPKGCQKERGLSHIIHRSELAIHRFF